MTETALNRWRGSSCLEPCGAGGPNLDLEEESVTSLDYNRGRIIDGKSTHILFHEFREKNLFLS